MAARTWLRRGLAAPLLAAALAITAGCGSDAETTAPSVESSSANATTTTSQSEPTTTEATTEQTDTGSGGGVSPTDETTTSEAPDDNGGGGGGNSGGVSPGYDPSQPDSSTNDVPAQPGTPQGSFEQYCNENPGACGD